MKKKLKIITLCIMMLLISILIFSQPDNKMTYIDRIYGANGVFYQTREINIDTLVAKGYINKRLGDSIVNWWPDKMIVDTSRNSRLVAYEFAVKWTGAEASDMLDGSYIGHDTLKVAFFNLVHGDYYFYKRYQYELILRFSKELDGLMANKVGELCFAKLKHKDEFTYGYLRFSYDENSNTAYLMEDTLSGNAKEVEFNTVAKYTDKLAEHYPKVKN